MSIIDEQHKITDALERLLPKLRVAFAVNCAEQSVKYYINWYSSEPTHWGKPEVLEQAIISLWDDVDKKPHEFGSENAVYDLVAKCVPDTEQFPAVSGNGALDAGLALLEAIDCAKNNGSIENALAASYYACLATGLTRDTQDFSSMSQLELRAYAETDSPEAVNEFNRQIGLINGLATINKEETTSKMIREFIAHTSQ